MIVCLVHFDISFPTDEAVIASLVYLVCLASRWAVTDNQEASDSTHVVCAHVYIDKYCT